MGVLKQMIKKYITLGGVDQEKFLVVKEDLKIRTPKKYILSFLATEINKILEKEIKKIEKRNSPEQGKPILNVDTSEKE